MDIPMLTAAPPPMKPTEGDTNSIRRTMQPMLRDRPSITACRLQGSPRVQVLPLSCERLMCDWFCESEFSAKKPTCGVENHRPLDVPGPLLSSDQILPVGGSHDPVALGHDPAVLRIEKDDLSQIFVGSFRVAAQLGLPGFAAVGGKEDC